jgi:hypothetical protein
MLIISIERSTAANAAPEGPQEANSQVIVRAAPQGGLPVVARITGDGTIHLLYEVNTELMCARSIDGGKTFDQGLPVVPTSPDPRLKFTGEDMAVTQTGRVFVALSTDGWKFKVPKEQMGFHLSILEPGKGSFGPVRNVNLMPSSGYALAVADDRQLALTWFSRTLYWSKSDDAGATFTPNTVVGADYQVCECCTTRAAYGANGDLAIMYRERTDNHRDMYVALIKKDGSHTRKRVSQVSWDINMCPMTYWDFHATANGYLAVWPTRGRLYFNRISADGDPVSVTEIKTDGQTTMRSQPLALTNSKDYVLIGWRQQGELRWQVYDAGNNPVGVRGSAPGASLAAAGVVDKFGQFILIP